MKVHLIGIGGSGLSAIALLLKERGYDVSGSDLVISPQTERLTRAGIKISEGHRADQVLGANLVIRSSAIPDNNPEVLAAQSAGIQVLKRADYLGKLTADSYLIALAGTHGKTTTSAMVAWLLTALNQDPSYIVGGIIENLRTNARAGSGHTFVIEADEYDYMFHGLNPDLAVVTNVEFDHPDLFPDANIYFAAFTNFIQRIKADGQLLYCHDDPGAVRLSAFARRAGVKTFSYGLAGKPDYLGDNIRESMNGGPVFDFRRGDNLFVKVALQIPGLHNVQNAMAALAVIDQLGLSVAEAAQALRDFRGAQRRFQVRGSASGVTVVDDYAHHPSEIRATLKAARGQFPGRRIWAVWQPHTYLRTETFFDEFVGAFQVADQVIVTEIYAARETPSADFSAQNLVEAMDRSNAFFARDFETVIDTLLENLEPDDVVLVLSAGDANVISGDLLDALDRTDPGRPAVGSKTYRSSPVIK